MMGQIATLLVAVTGIAEAGYGEEQAARRRAAFGVSVRAWR